MTTRRLFVGMLLLFALSLISWVRADNAPPTCCEPVVAKSDDCIGRSHDEALQRYRTNQSHHWRQIVIGTH